MWSPSLSSTLLPQMHVMSGPAGKPSNSLLDAGRNEAIAHLMVSHACHSIPQSDLLTRQHSPQFNLPGLGSDYDDG